MLKTMVMVVVSDTATIELVVLPFLFFVRVVLFAGFLLVTIDAMSPRVDHHPDAAEDDGHDGDGDDDDDDDDDGVTGMRMV